MGLLLALVIQSKFPTVQESGLHFSNGTKYKFHPPPPKNNNNK